MEHQYFKQTRKKCNLGRLYEIVLDRMSYENIKDLLKEKERRVKEEIREEKELGFIVRNASYEV